MTAAKAAGAGVQAGQHVFQAMAVGVTGRFHGNARPGIGHLDTAVFGEGDGDVFALTGQSLVDGAFHDVEQQLIQAAFTGRADVHTGPLAHRVEPFPDLNASCVGSGGFLAHEDPLRCCPAELVTLREIL
ncbi:hypothetical protein [Streptomyces scabiei]|uniref:hypothetical protein n=1 Tax=Streptomyces scabiei TaxID=1930 RepID=UPI0039F52C09